MWHTIRPMIWKSLLITDSSVKFLSFLQNNRPQWYKILPAVFHWDVLNGTPPSDLRSERCDTFSLQMTWCTPAQHRHADPKIGGNFSLSQLGQGDWVKNNVFVKCFKNNMQSDVQLRSVSGLECRLSVTSDLPNMLYCQRRAGPVVNTVTPQQDAHGFDCRPFLNEFL